MYRPQQEVILTFNITSLYGFILLTCIMLLTCFEPEKGLYCSQFNNSYKILTINIQLECRATPFLY